MRVRAGSAMAAVGFSLCGFQAVHAVHEPFYCLLPYLPLALGLENLGLLGALTGTALAYLTAISWFGHASVIVSTAPASELAVILAGLPLAATIGGWLFAGRQPPVIARQPLE